MVAFWISKKIPFTSVNPIPHGIIFSWLPWGAESTPPYGKSILECLSPILFYTVNYTYIRNSNLKVFCPISKTLDLAAHQSLAVHFIYVLN